MEFGTDALAFEHSDNGYNSTNILLIGDNRTTDLRRIVFENVCPKRLVRYNGREGVDEICLSFPANNSVVIRDAGHGGNNYTNKDMYTNLDTFVYVFNLREKVQYEHMIRFMRCIDILLEHSPGAQIHIMCRIDFDSYLYYWKKVFEELKKKVTYSCKMHGVFSRYRKPEWFQMSMISETDTLMFKAFAPIFQSCIRQMPNIKKDLSSYFKSISPVGCFIVDKNTLMLIAGEIVSEEARAIEACIYDFLFREYSRYDKPLFHLNGAVFDPYDNVDFIDPPTAWTRKNPYFEKIRGEECFIKISDTPAMLSNNKYDYQFFYLCNFTKNTYLMVLEDRDDVWEEMKGTVNKMREIFSQYDEIEKPDKKVVEPPLWYRPSTSAPKALPFRRKPDFFLQ